MLRTLALARTSCTGSLAHAFHSTSCGPSCPSCDRQAHLAEPIDAQLRTPFQKSRHAAARARLVLYQRLQAQRADSLTQPRLPHRNHPVPAGLCRPVSPPFGHRQKGRSNTTPPPSRSHHRHRPALRHHGPSWVICLTIPHDRQRGQSQRLAELPATPCSGRLGTGDINPNVMAYAALGSAWRNNKPEQFNKLVEPFREISPSDSNRSSKERRGSSVQCRPAVLHQHAALRIAFFFAIFSWLKWPDVLGRGALLARRHWPRVATAGIVTRMWLEGRPPVTNLYSSALFVGWGAVALCLVLEVFLSQRHWQRRRRHDRFRDASHRPSPFAQRRHARNDARGARFELLARDARRHRHLRLCRHVPGRLPALIYIARGVFTKISRQSHGRRAGADGLWHRVLRDALQLRRHRSSAASGPTNHGAVSGAGIRRRTARCIIVMWNADHSPRPLGWPDQQRGLMCLAIFGNIVDGLELVRHEHARRGAAQLWLHGFGVLVALCIFVLTQVAVIALASVATRQVAELSNQDSPERRASTQRSPLQPEMPPEPPPMRGRQFVCGLVGNPGTRLEPAV